MKIFLKQKDFHFSYFLWIFIKTAFLSETSGDMILII